MFEQEKKTLMLFSSSISLRGLVTLYVGGIFVFQAKNIAAGPVEVRA